MPPERYPSDDPREWLNRAGSNLALAKNRGEGAYLEDLCFEAQQAAEKSIKAVMIKRRSNSPTCMICAGCWRYCKTRVKKSRPRSPERGISHGMPRILDILEPQSRLTSNDIARSRKPSSDGLKIGCNE